MASSIHGTCVAIGGAGALLLGPSGSGKSDLALRLIDQGAELVADDRVELRVAGAQVLASAPVARSAPPGTVLAGDGLVVACGEGALELLRVQRAGRAAMSGPEFLRGRKIAPGTVLA